MRCDVIAQGIIQAAEHLDLRIPIVVRLQGDLRLLGFFFLPVKGLRVRIPAFYISSMVCSRRFVSRAVIKIKYSEQ